MTAFFNVRSFLLFVCQAIRVARSGFEPLTSKFMNLVGYQAALSRYVYEERYAAAHIHTGVGMNYTQLYAAALLVCESVHRLLRAHKIDGVLQSRTQLARTLWALNNRRAFLEHTPIACET